METHIFYWTGVVIWWCFCACVMAVFVFAPIYVFVKTKKAIWSWALMAEIAHTGFDQKDISEIALRAGGPRLNGYEDFFKWAETVKEMGDYVKKRKETEEQ